MSLKNDLLKATALVSLAIPAAGAQQTQSPTPQSSQQATAQSTNGVNSTPPPNALDTTLFSASPDGGLHPILGGHLGGAYGVGLTAGARNIKAPGGEIDIEGTERAWGNLGPNFTGSAGYNPKWLTLHAHEKKTPLGDFTVAGKGGVSVIGRQGQPSAPTVDARAGVAGVMTLGHIPHFPKIGSDQFTVLPGKFAMTGQASESLLGHGFFGGIGQGVDVLHTKFGDGWLNVNERWGGTTGNDPSNGPSHSISGSFKLSDESTRRLKYEGNKLWSEIVHHGKDSGEKTRD